jgi:hypothetical protein
VAEVQQHGNAFEDIKIQELTGITKYEYDKLKPNGYTSSFDLSEGVIVSYNASIKTTGKKTVECADILKRMLEKEYRLIVGCYTQQGGNKFFHTEYEFFITSDLLTFVLRSVNINIISLGEDPFMIGKLDPEERVMNYKTEIYSQVGSVIKELGWEDTTT